MSELNDNVDLLIVDHVVEELEDEIDEITLVNLHFN